MPVAPRGLPCRHGVYLVCVYLGDDARQTKPWVTVNACPLGCAIFLHVGGAVGESQPMSGQTGGVGWDGVVIGYSAPETHNLHTVTVKEGKSRARGCQMRLSVCIGRSVWMGPTDPSESNQDVFSIVGSGQPSFRKSPVSQGRWVSLSYPDKQGVRLGVPKSLTRLLWRISTVRPLGL